MPQKRYKPEEIIHKLRVAEVESSKGHNTGQICRKLGITEQTYYRWRKQYGGMKVEQAIRFKELEAGLTYLQISFDGATKETYEKARTLAKFEKVSANIEEFNRLRNVGNYPIKKFGIECLISNTNVLHEVPGLVKLGSQWGVDEVHVKSRIKEWEKHEGGNYSYTSKRLAREYVETKEVVQQAKDLAKQLNIRFTFSSDSRYSTDAPCPWPSSTLYVTTEGKIVPCCVLGQPESWDGGMGDLTTQSLGEIWNNERYRILRKRLTKGDYPTQCVECHKCE